MLTMVILQLKDWIYPMLLDIKKESEIKSMNTQAITTSTEIIILI